MNKLGLSVMVLILFVMNLASTKQISCGKKKFYCLSEERFYSCLKSGNDQYIVKREIKSCPYGAVCNDFDNEPCDEQGISREFLTDQTFLFKYGDKEGRKHIIDD
ncbi:uncharacterized protein LOC115874443 [Sitophilus oryzae]|uniref:Uncharacterized protein LOC115874443 n=1 Tax=Sitophilus oryzae TaxID=7048 RepID=A0A6J2X3F2_SITOR|nr:uncharacterized protein LOC115874443 [Sitophilus oryzae]